MKKLSIIIVNYNVCYFLEQTLISVRKAIKNIEVEIVVVDNNSVDNSAEMIRTKFPQVILIENKKNVGFSKANNQGIKIATGEYILLLNPDTVIEEDTLTKCCKFLDERPDAGGLGVKMLDGKGNFLPESKRGLPSPMVAFYKIFGLSKLFPKSKVFGRYHLGYLDQDQIHQVEILSGACMFLRKSVLNKTGLLDEDYFMYGEDIDLSYRIIKAGYKNYYFPETRIIHYKGESTKKTSVNYVFVFYKAMIIFARKHFSSGNAGMFSFLINAAIYLRALMTILGNIAKQSLLPLLDMSFIYGGMYFLKTYWEENHKWVPGKYPPEYMQLAVPVYIFIWLSSIFFSGGYDKPVRISRIVLGAAIGSFVISALSNFLDAYRFSKALIILGGVWTIFAVVLIRFIIHFIKYKNINLEKGKKKRIVLIGSGKESHRVIGLLNEINYNVEILGYLSTDPKEEKSEMHLGNIEQIKEIIEIYNADEVIFCSKDTPANHMIEWMTRIDSRILEYKMVPDETNYIIGSNSKDKQGDFYTLNIELNIIQKNNIRNKRVLDLLIGFSFLLLYPVLMWVAKNPLKFLKNILRVLSGEYSWVGFTNQDQINLPKIRKGIISPVSYIHDKNLDAGTIHRLNMLYAKDYNLYTDIELIFRSLKYLG
ncbi:MAG: glycosyltransferase family 2 protein [Cytophagaceae bacterium]|nr:glycosyltransferase family 2 protein [Cytophagaceae bacterium]